MNDPYSCSYTRPQRLATVGVFREQIGEVGSRLVRGSNAEPHGLTVP